MSDAVLPRIMAAPRARRMRRPLIVPWLFLLPVLLTFTVWVYAPLLRAGWLAFFEWNMMPDTAPTYVGLANFRNIFGLPKLWVSLRNTGIYMVGLLPFAVLFPFAIAIYTQDLPPRARAIYRGLIFVPMIIAPVVAASVWRWLLDPGHGVVNGALRAVGLGPVSFLASPNWAIWTIIFITGWKLVGFATLIASAANARINPALIEAARMDGATGWAIIRHIRLPLLMSTAMLLVTMSILLGAQWTFSYINVLTDGGPLGATTNIYYLLWEFGFSSMSVGWSSASAVVLFVGFAGLAWGLFALTDRWSFHDD